MSKRICITGAGIISSLGIGIDETLRNLLDEQSGINPVSILETIHSDIPVGEVRMDNKQLGKLAKAKPPVTELRTALLGIIAARQALEAARLSETDIADAAFINGTTVGGMDKTERDFKEIFNDNGDLGSECSLRNHDCGAITAHIADSLGSFKIVTTTSTACSSAANAVILGAEMIKSGLVNIAVVGGSEALTRFHLNGFNTLMILDKERCRPFDRDRAGINLGEGAAYLVIENEEAARRRNATVLAELSGYANSCDAFHQTATSDTGEGPYLSMRNAMDMAGLGANDISYINTHGTGTPNNDESELTAMERIFGDLLPPFSSTKPFTGHTTSAAGAIESVISLLAMQQGLIPANLGFANPIRTHARPITSTTSGIDLRHVINNSFGFGGNDSTLIFSNPDRHAHE